jgi:hypothetical protein
MGRCGVAFRTVRASDVRQFHPRPVIGGVHPVRRSEASRHRGEEEEQAKHGHGENGSPQATRINPCDTAASSRLIRLVRAS